MKTLPEIQTLKTIAAELGKYGKLEELASVQDRKGNSFPLLKMTIGNPSPTAPVLGLVGGVHGLERIGAQVCLAYLNTLAALALWDENTKNILEKIRIFFIPVLNPGGISDLSRSNANGVDLMRNAPVEAEGAPFMLGGQNYSPWLPWYRGNGKLEPEAQALVDAVKSEIKSSPTAITIDIHSGFGVQDQLWYPYAKTKDPFPNYSQMQKLKNLFDRTHPNHFYRIERQVYTTHGDLWDYIYDGHRKENPQNLYLPLCLEMGSWMWVKKNPLQLFSATGPFNPIKKHREKRILRRHNTLFEFFIKALCSPRSWNI